MKLVQFVCFSVCVQDNLKLCTNLNEMEQRGIYCLLSMIFITVMELLILVLNTTNIRKCPNSVRKKLKTKYTGTVWLLNFHVHCEYCLQLISKCQCEHISLSECQTLVDHKFCG